MSKIRVLVIDDEESIRRTLRVCLESADYAVTLAASGEAGLAAARRAPPDVVLVDRKMPGLDGVEVTRRLLQEVPSARILMMTAYATIDHAVEAVRAGAVDYLPKPFTPDQVLGAIGRATAAASLEQELSEMRRASGRVEPLLTSQSTAFQQTLAVAARVAATEATVLVLGETGTGKGVLTRHLHALSARRSRPFVTVNCAVVSSSLIENELFGHARGAFTGADAARAGYVEAAANGTLFLDEVGELPREVQGKLLRLLEERDYVRIGDTEPRRSEARVVAATHRDLRAEVAAGRFREDLYFRLAVVTLRVPPLRERREDIAPLVAHLLRSLAAQHRRPELTVEPGVLAALEAYPWPGNLRELTNVLERAVILAAGATLTPDLLPEEVRQHASVLPSGPDDERLESAERRHIAAALARHPTLDAAARALGIDPSTLYRKRERYGLRLVSMRVSLRQRLALGLLALSLLLLALAALAVVPLSRLGRAVGTILQENYVSVIACAEMNEALERLDSAALFAASGRADIARPLLVEHRDAFARALDRESHNITLPGEAERVARLQALWRDYLAHVEQLVQSPRQGDTELYFRELLPRFTELKLLVRDISRLNQLTMEQADRNARALGQQSIRLALTASLLALLLAAALTLWLPRAIIQPLASLQDAARRVGEGDLDVAVRAPAVAELVPLADAFAAMLSHLRAYRDSSLGELLAAQDLARSTIACLADPVMVFRHDGATLLVNEAASRAFDAQESSRPDERLPQALLDAARRALETGHPVAPASLSDALRHPTPEGDRFYLLRAAPLVSDGREPPRALLVAQDVSRFRQIDEEKSLAIATVSHEFKTPLTSLRMATHLLLEPRLGALSEAQRELVTTARDDVERLGRLVDEYLDLTRIEAEAGALRRAPVALAPLLAQLVDAHLALAEQRGVQLTAEPLASTLPAPLDLEKIRIALSNLVANALQHTPPGGRVTLSARRDPDAWVVQVRDSGEGIAPGELPHLFDRFRRGESVAPDPRRLGLGLAITREIVRQHGGEVQVESTPGQGSSFSLRLPLA